MTVEIALLLAAASAAFAAASWGVARARRKLAGTTYERVRVPMLVNPAEVWREWTPEAEAAVSALPAAAREHQQDKETAAAKVREDALAVLAEHLPADATPSWVARGDEGRVTLTELAAIVAAAARHASQR